MNTYIRLLQIPKQNHVFQHYTDFDNKKREKAQHRRHSKEKKKDSKRNQLYLALLSVVLKGKKCLAFCLCFSPGTFSSLGTSTMPQMFIITVCNKTPVLKIY